MRALRVALWTLLAITVVMSVVMYVDAADRKKIVFIPRR